MLIMTASESHSLFAQASLGKTIGRLVFVPILIGASAHLMRRNGPGAALRATLAAICAVGCSPSLVFAAALVLVPFTAAGLWDLWPTRAQPLRSQLRATVCLLAPLGFIGCFALIANFMQEGAGESQYLAGPDNRMPIDAWQSAVGTLNDFPLTVVFIAGRSAVLPLLLSSRRSRRAGALLIVTVFGIVLAPWTYEPLVGDLLDLNYFAARFLWSVPVGLVVGIALANIDARKTVGLLTVAALTIGLGLSGPDDLDSLKLFSIDADVRDAPPVWPWDAGFPAGLDEAASALVAVTPEGGRFLAPPGVEEVATAMQIDRFPVYARAHYVTAVGRADEVPDGFFVEDRELLSQGISGAAADVPSSRWSTALDRVDVDTVCIDQSGAPGLREAVSQTYAQRGSTVACDLWARPGP